MKRFLFAVSAFAIAMPTASAYVEVRYSLAYVVAESSNIVVMKLEKVNKERRLLYFKKVVDLKGTHAEEEIKHNIGAGGFNQREKDLPIEWAEPGKIAIFFYKGGASETCLGKWWYQTYAGGAWWNHSHGEPYMCRTFCGTAEDLRAAVEKILKGEEVVIPATVSKTDLRIQKVRTTPKDVNAYVVVEAPTIERTALTGVAGFSDMIELPRPEGRIRGGIPADVDGDGYPDLLLVGDGGLRLLRNNTKGNFDDVTDKWGLAGDTGAPAAAFADYNGSGRLSLFTAGGKLYTNLGDKFKDDSALLPATPARVRNPGEAMGWADIDGDGRPDIVCSVGVRGLVAWRNTGGADGKWFEDVSDKVGLGDKGLGQEASNFLTVLDIDGDGRSDFVLNVSEPLVALNRNGVFTRVDDTGLKFPALARPALASADYLNDGRTSVLVTSNERMGALGDWQMIGPFSADEDKQIAVDGTFSPKTKADVKIEGVSWRRMRPAAGGVLRVGRRSPSPNAVYACATFDRAKEEKATLHVGSLNGLTMWLNGKEVYAFKGNRAFTPDVDKVEVDLVAGENTLLLKVFDEGPVWQTCVRVLPAGLFPPASVQLLRGDGKGKYENVAVDAGDLAQLREDAVSAIWADMDNDGFADLVVAGSTGLVRVYRNTGDGKFAYHSPQLGLEQKFKAVGAAVADFDRNGTLDVVLIDADPAPPVVLFSRIPGKFAPLTVGFAGPDGWVGALVSVLDAEGKVRATHTLGAGDGRNLQTATQARFALPAGKYKVRVKFTSGSVRELEVDHADKPNWVVIDGMTPTGK